MNIFKKLDLKPGINAWGTVTKLGGTRLAPEVTQAMTEAAVSFIPMHEFHKKAGEYTAGLLGVEACCITCGAAAGLAISSAACMTRGERSKVLQLPDTTGMSNEILMLKSHRILYDQALSLSGAVVREVGSTSFSAPDLLEAEINEKTALFVYVAENENVRGSTPLQELVPCLKKSDIPILVDAAAELPPVENISKYLDMGADLVVFSGGKEFRGPQNSGLIIGKTDLIEACHANCCPNYSIGRSMKISKESIAGLVAAVELFIKKDYKLKLQEWEEMSRRIYTSFENNKNILPRTGYPTEPGIQPACILRAYLKPLTMTAADLQQKLLDAPIPVYVDVLGDEIVINPQCLDLNELAHVIDILQESLNG